MLIQIFKFNKHKNCIKKGQFKKNCNLLWNESHKIQFESSQCVHKEEYDAKRIDVLILLSGSDSIASTSPELIGFDY